MDSISFIETLQVVTARTIIIIKEEKELRKEEFEFKKQYRKNELFTFLTKKYNKLLKLKLIDAAQNGLYNIEMTFEYNDFKADFPTLGNPKYICKCWIDEMCNKDSKYLINKELYECFIGLNYKILNKPTLIVKFNW